MNVLEIKNNLVKIAYDAQDNLALSGFVIIEDSNNPYVAQVMNIKGDNNSNFAIVKLLFTFDEDGILKNYNGTIPSINAKVSALPSNELLDIIPIDSPIFMGNLAQQGIPLNADKSIFENNLLICSDNLYNTTNLIGNLIEQIEDKNVIIDTEGQINSDNKIKLGVDFKLPLNYETIDFIYENDLEDVDAINKAIIQDVFIEVQNYVKSLPEKFLPFETFIDVIDGQYKETQIPELILLKNKLLKYKAMNVFAQDLKDVMKLTITVENSTSTVIDISDVPDNVKKEVLRYVYDVLNDVGSKVYSFVKINNSNVTKKLLKRFTEKNNVFTTIICPHEFKYIEELKEVSQNIIFFAPLTLTHDFASYNTYLSKLNGEEFVIYGAHTQNIPFIVEVANIEDKAEPVQQSKEETTHKSVEEEVVVEPQKNEDTSEYIDSFEEELEVQPEVAVQEDVEEQETEPEIVEQPENIEIIEETQPVSEDEIIDDGVEENIEEEPEEVIEPEITEENSTVVEPLISEEAEEQITKDVDRMFYEKIEDNEPDDFADTSEDLTEDDLNMIEDLSIDDVPLAGESEEEVNTDEEEKPPVVPIYPADDIEQTETEEFRAGERIYTAKFGEGIVKGMIKYGNKMLCSADFPNIGRRLLDPSMTEIRKLL